MQIIYRAKDGKDFTDKAECEAHGTVAPPLDTPNQRTMLHNWSLQMSTDNYHVDGTDNHGCYAGDGSNPPFVIFDSSAQKNLPGYYRTRQAAEWSLAHIRNENRPPMPVSNVPNLDAMEADDLWKWAYPRNSRVYAKELFPEGGAGTVTATSNLCAYAINKATAMRCRVSGDIDAALVYERICDRIYKELPEWAKW